MATHTRHMTNRNIETSYTKKGLGFSDCMTAVNRLFKLRSSRGYGSRKSAYGYYMRNI